MAYTAVLRFWPHNIHKLHSRAWVVLCEFDDLDSIKAVLRVLMTSDPSQLALKIAEIRPREITTPAGLCACYDLVFRSERGTECTLNLGIDADGARRALFKVGDVLHVTAALVLDPMGNPVHVQTVKVPDAIDDILKGGDFKTSEDQFEWTRTVNRKLNAEVSDPLVMKAGFESQKGTMVAICKSHNGMIITAFWAPRDDGVPVRIQGMQPGLPPDQWDMRRFHELYDDPSTHVYIRSGAELLSSRASFDRLAIVDAAIFAEAYGIAGL